MTVLAFTTSSLVKKKVQNIFAIEIKIHFTVEIGNIISSRHIEKNTQS